MVHKIKMSRRLIRIQGVAFAAILLAVVLGGISFFVGIGSFVGAIFFQTEPSVFSQLCMVYLIMTIFAIIT